MPRQTPRISPLQPPYPPDIEAALRKWMPPDSALEPLLLFRTLVVHERLSSRMRSLAAGILGAGAKLAPRLREVMIHRTCALTGAGYEWGVHAVAFGTPLGFGEEQLRSTVHGAWSDDCWEPDEGLVFRLADELHETSTISDELWRELAACFDDAQLLELIVAAGFYHLIAYICNGVRVQPEEWAPDFPAAGAA